MPRRHYRRRMPPKVPRTMARPMVPPIEPPIDFPRSAAIWPATRLVTERVTSRDHALTGRQSRAAWNVGAEYGADHATDLTEQSAASTLLRLALLSRSRCCSRILHTLLQDLVGGFQNRPACRIFPSSGLLSITALRSTGVTGPIRAEGGRIMVRSTMDGTPLPSRNETRASPLPSSVIDLGRVEILVRPKSLRGSPDRFLIARRERP